MESFAVSEQIASLRERVANQELSAEDVNRMGRERQRLKEGMCAASEQKAKAQQRRWEAELCLNKALEALEDATREYTSKAQAMQLVPAGAKNANGQNYEIVIDRMAAVRQEGGATGGKCTNLINNDIHGFIIPALAQMKEAVAKRMYDARQQLLDLLDAEEAR